MKRFACISVAAMAVALAASREARAQGLIIDRRPHVPIQRAYEVREVSVDARIRDQVASVQVSQTFHNPGSFELETEYFFPLPDEGAIQNFVLMVDGREMPGRILPKDEARKIYEEIVRTKRDPALLEYMGRGLFRTSVFPIPPGADRKVTMTYTQICRRDRDVVEFSYPFATQKVTAKPIQNLRLSATISSQDPIKSLYSPTHAIDVRRSGNRDASLSLAERDVIPNSDFRIVYTLAEGALGATVLSYRPSASEDGYFVLMASPEVKPADAKPMPKTIVMVIDRSGSMTGKKIEQAQAALKFILNNLRDGDLFNIVAYDDRVETFKPELQRFTPETRGDAVRFVENIRPGGSTNIDGALKASLAMVKDDSRPSYVMFLTDGLPTAGETREPVIADNVRQQNATHARVFVFGVGYDVNARLLDRISGANGGASEYVKENDDLETHVGRYYAKMSSPVLANLSIEMANTDLNRTYPRSVPDLFDGGQLVWAGRYRQSGKTTVKVRGKVGAESRTAEFPVELASPGQNMSYDFVEKLWAVRRVGDIIDQIDLHGANKELTDELVALSARYGILTPYTAFLADERVQLHASAANAAITTDNFRMLSELGGAGGVAQRSMKGRLQTADNATLREFQRGAAAGAASEPIPLVGDQSRLGAVAGRKPGSKSYEKRLDAQVAMKQIGTKTFFRKGDRWMDSGVTPEAEKAATDVEQFSEAYFTLAKGQKAEMNQYLTLEEPVTVDLNGKVYRINRAVAKK